MKKLFSVLFSAAFVITFPLIPIQAAETLPPAKHQPLAVSEFRKLFKEISPREMEGNPFKLVGKDCFLITAGNLKSYNSMTAGWGGFGILWGKPVTFTFVRNNRFTYQFLEKEPYYTLSFFDNPSRMKLMTVFGRKSGRDTDKVKESGFTPVAVPGGGVAYTQARMVILCKRLAGVPLTKGIIPADISKKTYGDTGDFHKQYIGEIIGIWVTK